MIDLIEYPIYYEEYEEEPLPVLLYSETIERDEELDFEKPPKYSEYCWKWIEDHTDHEEKYEYLKANPIYLNEIDRIMNNNKRGFIHGTLTEEQWFLLLKLYKRKCAYCNCKLRKHVLEHVLPIRLGGITKLENVVPSCQKCNIKKGVKRLELFLDRNKYNRFILRNKLIVKKIYSIINSDTYV